MRLVDRRMPAVLALAVALVVLPPDAPARADFNPQLAVVPTMREWHGADGTFNFQQGARIVVDSTDANTLLAAARLFREDLAALTGTRPEIAVGSHATPGDVFLTLRTEDAGLGAEGYLLEIGVGVSIRAHTAAGVFYGSRSVLQLLVASHSSSLPRGRGRDYPEFAERGFVLDVSSRFVPISVLKRYIRYLA